MVLGFQLFLVPIVRKIIFGKEEFEKFQFVIHLKEDLFMVENLLKFDFGIRQGKKNKKFIFGKKNLNNCLEIRD